MHELLRFCTCSFNPDLRAYLSFFLLVRMNNLDLASCELDMVIFAAHIMLAVFTLREG